jgi:hypothetical protein
VRRLKITTFLRLPQEYLRERQVVFSYSAKAIIWNIGFMIMRELMMIPSLFFFDNMLAEPIRLSATVFMMKLP